MKALQTNVNKHTERVNSHYVPDARKSGYVQERAPSRRQFAESWARICRRNWIITKVRCTPQRESRRHLQCNAQVLLSRLRLLAMNECNERKQIDQNILNTLIVCPKRQ